MCIEMAENPILGKKKRKFFKNYLSKGVVQELCCSGQHNHNLGLKIVKNPILGKCIFFQKSPIWAQVVGYMSPNIGRQ